MNGYEFVLGIKQVDPELENMWNKPGMWVLLFPHAFRAETVQVCLACAASGILVISFKFCSRKFLLTGRLICGGVFDAKMGTPGKTIMNDALVCIEFISILGRSSTHWPLAQ